MQYDLNDILAFSAVAEHRGFSAAARALRQPKSSVSRQVERLEGRLGIRLLERTTRRVRLTEVGALYYARCRTVLAELEAAESDVALHRDDPVGIIKVSCPTGIAQHVIATILPGFMALYPSVRVKLLAANRIFDLIEERIDVAIRARPKMRDEPVILRKLGKSALVVVASPGFVRDHGRLTRPGDLTQLPFLSSEEDVETPTWTFCGPKDVTQIVTFRPILWTGDTTVLLEAAAEGLGIALLPLQIVAPMIAAGKLVRQLPEWRTNAITVCLVYPSKRGLRPAVRAFIDYLAENVALTRNDT